MSKINIDGSGRLELPISVAKEIGAASLELVCHSNAHLLFSNIESGFRLAGVLGEIAMVDVLSFLNMFRKTGTLVISLSGGQKEIGFLRGEIVTAVSSFPEEDICSVLFEMGKLQQDMLPRCRQMLAGGGNVRVLVERGGVAPKDLWLATRNQVENILFNLFGLTQGSFFFLEKEPEKEKMVRLAMNTQNLIMEGLRRVDERALFMRVIRSMDAIPKVAGSSDGAGLEGDEARLYALIAAGDMEVRSLLRRSGMGEFEGLKVLYELINKRVVTIEDAPATAVAGDLGEILLIFNGALTALYRKISAKNSGFRDEVGNFIRQMPSPFSYVFEDVTLRDDGAVDGRKVLTNLSGLEEQDKKRLLAEALSELVYMECMAAQRDLGQDGSARLIQKVQEVPRRVKSLLVKKQFSDG